MARTQNLGLRLRLVFPLRKRRRNPTGQTSGGQNRKTHTRASRVNCTGTWEVESGKQENLIFDFPDPGDHRPNNKVVPQWQSPAGITELWLQLRLYILVITKVWLTKFNDFVKEANHKMMYDLWFIISIIDTYKTFLDL